MKRLIPISLMAFLISCAPTKDPFGLALRQGHAPSFTTPESLTVNLGVEPQGNGLPPFAARLYARPFRQYRLDVTGLTSPLASYIWSDSTGLPQGKGHWALLLHERRQIWKGEGDSLNIAGLPLQLPGMNALLGFLWGDPLPGFNLRDSETSAWSGDTLRWSVKGIPWEALIDTTSGVCREARSASLKFQYTRPKRMGYRVVAREVNVFSKGQPLLRLRVHRVNDHPLWKKDPFVWVVPISYEIRSPELTPFDEGVLEK